MKNNNRKFCGISKRLIALFICMTSVLAALPGTAFAAGSSYRRAGRGKIISEEAAIGYACQDIGVDVSEAEILTTEIVYEEGQYAYKICLAADGIKYLYNIRVYDGAVLKTSYTTITYKNKGTAPKPISEEENTETEIN